MDIAQKVLASIGQTTAWHELQAEINTGLAAPLHDVLALYA